jgi:hypothetical protein
MNAVYFSNIATQDLESRETSVTWSTDGFLILQVHRIPLEHSLYAESQPSPFK